MINEHTDIKDISSTDGSITIVERYVLTIGKCHGKDVLDFGCGCGHGTMLVHTYGAKKVIGYDINKEAIRLAKKRYGSDNNKTFTDDINYVKNWKYDVIISLENLEHLDEKSTETFLNLLNNNLKPNGLLILTTPIGDGKIISGKHKKEYTQEQILDLFKQNTGLNIELFYLEEKTEELSNYLLLKKEKDGAKCFFIFGKKD